MSKFWVYYRVGDEKESVSVEHREDISAAACAREILENKVPSLWLAAGALVSVERYE